MNILNFFLSDKRKAAKAAKKQLNDVVGKVRQAKAYLNEWNDMPMAWLYPELCNMLGIRNDNAGQRFCTGLVFRKEEDIVNELIKIANS